MMRDPQIRALVHAHLDRSLPDGAVVLDEFGISHHFVRADVAAFTPTDLDVYEIKSDADSCARLRWQVQGYGWVASRAFLVAGPAMFARAAGQVPEWWGLMRADAVAGLEIVREPQQNPEQDRKRIANLLWQTEVWDELKARGLSRGMSKSRSAWGSRLFDGLTLAECRALVHQRIAKREWVGRKGSQPRVIARAA